MVHLGPAVGGEGELADLVGHARGLQLLLGLTHPGHFRVGVDHAGDDAVVHVTGLARNQLDAGHALVLGLVRQHRPIGHVTDRPDAGGSGAEMVGGDEAPGVGGKAHGLKAEARRHRATTHRQQHHVRRQALRRAAGHGLEAQGDPGGRGLGPGDLLTQAEGDALLGHGPLEGLGQFRVRAGQGAVEIFHHRDLRPQAPPDRAQLQPDDPGADDDHRLRHGGEGQRPGGIDDPRLVHLDAGQTGRLGPRGDDDVAGVEHSVPAGTRDRDLARSGDAAEALDPLDLVLLEQEFDALGQGPDAVALLLLHLGKVELDRALDAQAGKVLARQLVEFGGVQQRLGRDAADVQAGAAQGRAALDTGHRQTQLTGPDGRIVPARPAADDDHVVLRHETIPGLTADCRMRE